jgi:prepilin-type N-terminal cleavage/methylation domain-containing protein
MMQMRRHRTPILRRGFTLVELLVAVALSAVIILAVFAVMITSSRTFRVQSDLAQATDQLNFALDTIRSDFRRAGFMTVPNAYLPEESYPWYESVCAPPTWLTQSGSGGVAHGLFLLDVPSGSTSAYYNPRPQDAVLVGETPDRFAMFGAFRATRSYRPISIASGSQTIIVENTADEQNRMEWMFDDAVLAVTSPQGGTQFLLVSDVVADITQTTITTTSPLLADPSGGAAPECEFQGFGSQLYEVVPLQFVEYSIQNDPDDPEATVMVREELDGSFASFTPPSRYVVARNLLDMQVWFDGVTNGGVAAAVNRDTNAFDAVGTLADTALNGGSTATPQNARLAYVQLSARLDEPIGRGISEGSDVDLREYVELRNWNGTSYVYNNEFTRVLTIRGEAELANFSLRDL